MLVFQYNEILSKTNTLSRVLKEEIAQLYYFKNNNQKNDTKNGYKQKNFVCEYGELTTKQWNEEKTKNKKLTGYWKYIARRTIDSLIKDCKFTTNNGEILNAYNEKTIDRKTYSRFIDSIITFLRYSKNISYGQDKNIKDFILYDKQGSVVKDFDYTTENERQKQEKKKSSETLQLTRLTLLFHRKVIEKNTKKSLRKSITTTFLQMLDIIDTECNSKIKQIYYRYIIIVKGK